MEKTAVKRLLHTLVPFLIMVALLKGIALLLDRFFTLDSALADLISFIPAALAAILLFRLRTYEVPGDDSADATEPLRPRGFPRCLLLLAANFALLVGLTYLMAELNGSAASEVVHTDRVPTLGVLPILSLCVIHPLIEEWIFRRNFYGELRLMNPIFGCLAQAVLFAIVHDTVDGMLFALGAGILLGALTEFSGRLWPAVAAHVGINLRSLFGLTLLAERGEIVNAADIAFGVVGAAALIALVILRHREAKAEKEEAAA